MKMWVDDLRPAPEGWTWITSSAMAISQLYNYKTIGARMEAMSLDHDLGGDDTTRSVVLWCCERNWWPDEVFVHTANPVGREWLEGMIERYKH